MTVLGWHLTNREEIMGYSYGRNDRGNLVLSSASCGNLGGVRKRTCPYKVHHADGFSLPYCYPSALCSTCYATHKATLHQDCAKGAAESQARENARAFRLASGEYEVGAAWGSWHEDVPDGMTGVVFRNVDKVEQYRLVRASAYDPSSRRYLSDYPHAQEWTTKENRKAS